MSREENPVLELEHLSVDLRIGRALRRVIHDVSLRVGAGEAISLVGESGSGKSMTARAIMRLLPEGARVGGKLTFGDRSVLELDRKALRAYHARDVAMIYQDPRSHINPVRTIGAFLLEGLLERGDVSKAEATERVVATLRDVGVRDAERRLRQYPGELSGGLLQRVMIAAALVIEPRLIIADEPTTALDVTTQQEVVAILDEQRRERDLAMVFITHDLDLATAITDRIAVMYAGVIVERGPSATLHETALHPYTVALLGARPSLERVERLRTVGGRPVSAYEVGPGCVFASRCPYADDRSRREPPETRVVDGHWVACHHAEELRGSMLKAEQG